LSEGKILGGAKCLILGEQQYFCLGRRFSKHKISRYAKNFGTPGPRGYAYGSWVKIGRIVLGHAQQQNYYSKLKLNASAISMMYQ